jgi:hypothetical protein
MVAVVVSLAIVTALSLAQRERRNSTTAIVAVNPTLSTVAAALIRADPTTGSMPRRQAQPCGLSPFQMLDMRRLVRSSRPHRSMSEHWDVVLARLVAVSRTITRCGSGGLRTDQSLRDWTSSRIPGRYQIRRICPTRR